MFVAKDFIDPKTEGTTLFLKTEKKFGEGLPDGLGQGELNQALTYLENFHKEFVSTSGDVALAALKKDKKLDKVVLTTPFGKRSDNITVSISREKKFRNVKTGEDILTPAISVATKFGALKVKSTISKVKDMLKAELS